MNNQTDDQDWGCGCLVAIPTMAVLFPVALYAMLGDWREDFSKGEKTPEQPESGSKQVQAPRHNSTYIDENSPNVHVLYANGNKVYLVNPNAQSNNYSASNRFQRQDNKKQLATRPAFKIDTQSKLNTLMFNLRNQNYRA